MESERMLGIISGVYLRLFSSLCIMAFLLFIPVFHNPNYVEGAYVKARPTSGGPSVNDPNLKVEVVFKNNGKLDTPTTSMAFLAPNDILVLEKNKGTVQRIVDGQLQSRPLLQVPVGNEIEWGMLGIAVSKSQGKTYVFLYYTEAKNGKHMSFLDFLKLQFLAY